MYNLQINELTPGQKYYVKVRAKAPGYATSEWSPAFEFEAEQDQIPPERVRNLTFTSEGDSFIARWEAPELNMDGTPCTDLSHYKITLVNFDASRTVHLETSNPEFTIDFNSNKQLFGTPSGIIEITVSAVDRVSNVGPGSSKIAQNMPPAKVNNVTAQSSVETVTLKWDPSVETDIEKYNVYVSNEGPDFAMTQATLAGSVAFGTNTFAHTTMSLSPLYFKVTAVDKFRQQSPASNVATAQPKLTTDFDKTPPGAVTNFTAVQSLAPDNATAIARLSFTAATDNDLDKYEVQYRKTGETTLPWSFLTIPSDQTSAEIKSLPLSTSYDFRIRAVDFLANKGDWSTVVVAPGIKKTTLPAAPTGVTVRGGTTNLMVTWNPSTDPSMANWAGTYEVQISKATTFTSPITIKTSSTLASFISLDANTIYYVRIRSIDPYGNTGAWSTRAQGNTGQALDPLASRIYWADAAPTGGRTNDVWIKIPENVQYRFDGTDWIKAQDTELADEIDNVRQTADGKNKAWYQTAKPPATNNTQGDIWFDTDDGNKLHVWSTSANDWVSAQDAAIQDALDNADEALQTADGKNTIFYSTPAAGVTPREGDTWFDNAVIKVYKNGAWVNASDDLDTAKARQAIQIAGSKNKTYYVAKASATGMIEGDILFDTAEGNKQYRYDGSTWVAVTDAAIAAAEEAAGQAQETADKKNTIYYSTPPTTGVRDGDTWFDGPTIKTYRNGVWTDSSSNLETQQGADAIQIAGSRNKTYYTTFANRPTTDLTEGDLLFDTGDKYKQYRYTNAGWLSVRDGTIADAKTAADNAQAAAERRAQTFYEANKPANTNSRLKVNDLWIKSSNNQLHRWTGSDWVEIQDDAIALTQSNLTTAVGDLQTSIGNVQAIADGKINTFISNVEPTEGLDEGDIWFDTSIDPVATKVYDGANWVVSGDKAALDAAAAVQVNLNATNANVNKKNTTYAQTSAPTAGLIAGDLWLDTTLVSGTPKNEMNRWDGSKWVKTQDKLIFDAQALADGKAKVFTRNSMPTNAESENGDIWFDVRDTPWSVKVRNGVSTWIESGDKNARDAAIAAQTEAERKIQSFYTDTDPATITANNVKAGDLWYKITDKRARVRASNNTWVELKDSAIKTAQDAADAAAGQAATAITNAGTAFDLADKKAQIFYGGTRPSNLGVNDKGDIWVNQAETPNEIQTWTGTTWVTAGDPATKTIAEAANALAGQKAHVYTQTTTPTSDPVPTRGDTWIHTTTGETKIYNGSTWIAMTDPEAQKIANRKITTYYDNVAPTAPSYGFSTGDLWVKTPENRLHRWSGAWVELKDKSITDLEALTEDIIDDLIPGLETQLDKKIEVYVQNDPPAITDAAKQKGDIWIRPDNGEVKVYSGTAWVLSADPAAKALANTAQTAANNAATAAGTAQTTADKKMQTFYGTNGPANNPAGTLKVNDLWIHSGTKRLHRWNGTIWEEVKDADITAAQQAAATANQAVGNLAGTVSGLETQVDKKVEVWFQTNQPAVPSAAADRLKMKGDIWINTSTGASNGEVKMYPGTGTVWNVVTDPAAIAAAQAAKDVADSKRQVFGGELPPSNTTGTTGNNLKVNDLWIRDSDKRMHRWGGSAWEVAQDAKIDGLEAKGTDLIMNGTGILGNNYNFSRWVFDPSDAPAGARGSFMSSSMNSVIEADSDIPYDTSKTYKLSYSLRKGNPDVGTGHYAGFVPKDAAGNTVGPSHYMFIGNTTTTLAAALNPGDTQVVLTNSANWYGTPGKNAGSNTHMRSIIFWDYTDTFGKTWAPETYSRNFYGGDKWADGAINPTTHTITLRAPYNGPMKPKGTVLSNGSSGSTYMYSSHGALTSDWTKYSATISGEMSGTTASGKDSASFATGVPPGTAFVKFFVITNHYSWSQAGSITKIAGISLSDASAAYDHATTAIQSANARNRNIYSTGNASGNSLNGYSFVDGDTWYRRDANDTIVGMWERKDNSWVAKTLNNQVIANLDAGKINAGTISADRIGANSISGQKLVIGRGENIVNDPEFTLPLGTSNAWVADSGITIAPEGLNNSNALKVPLKPSSQYVYNFPQKIPVESGARFRVVMTLKSDVPIPAGSLGVVFTINKIDGTTAWPVKYMSASPVLSEYTVVDFGIANNLNFDGNMSIMLSFSSALSSGTIWVNSVQVMRATGTTMIENGAITTEKVHAEAITASELAAGAVTADKIKANEIDASKIVSGGMDGSVVIEEGTITATEIAGKTITGDKIKGNTIDASHIVAGSITIGAPDSPLNPAGIATPTDVSTAKSEAISTANTNADTKVATALQTAAADAQQKADAAKDAAEQAAKQYADGEIDTATAQALIDAATTAQQKADAAKDAAQQAAKGYTDGQVGPINTAVTGINSKLGGWSHPTNTTFIDGGKIYTDSITAHQIRAGEIGADELAANAVTADKIAANSISAQKLVIGMGENFVNDPNFIADLGVNWATGAGITITNEGLNSSRSLKIVGSTAQQASYNQPEDSIVVEAGTKIRATVRVKSTGTIPANVVGIGLRHKSLTGVVTYPAYLYIPAQAQISAYKSIDLGIVDIPSDGTLTWFIIAQAGYSSRTIWFDNVQVMRAVGTTVIAKDAITTDKIYAQAITGAKIAGKTITVGNMGDGSVSNTVIQDGAITTEKILAKEIKAENIDSGAITADKIEAGAIRIGGNDSHIPAGAIANSGEVVPKVSSGVGTKVFRDLVAWRRAAQNLPGIIVIKTPMTFDNYMFNIEINGYNYRANSTNGADINLSVSGYAYSVGRQFYNRSVNNRGGTPVNASFYRTNDEVPQAAIVLRHGIDYWSYPQINITEATISGWVTPDELGQGWTIEYYEDESVVDGWEEYLPTLALDQATTSRIANGWRYNGTTTINGGAIEADTITAAQIRAGSITVGPDAPINPNQVATPAQLTAAEQKAANDLAAAQTALATDATNKANAAQAEAERLAKIYADTGIGEAETRAATEAARVAEAERVEAVRLAGIAANAALAPVKTTADGVKNLTDGWKYGDTTYINGGNIATRTIDAQSIKANSIVIGAANSPIANVPGSTIQAGTVPTSAINSTQLTTYIDGNTKVTAGSNAATTLSGLTALQGGVTVIDGGKIKTDSITALQIDGHTITANEIKAGTITGTELTTDLALVNRLKVQSSIEINHVNGHIKSSNYNDANKTGFYMDQQQLIVHDGRIEAAAIKLQEGANLLPPHFAQFTAGPAWYQEPQNLQQLHYLDSAIPLATFEVSRYAPELIITSPGGFLLGETANPFTPDPATTYIFSLYALKNGSTPTFKLGIMGDTGHEWSQDFTESEGAGYKRYSFAWTSAEGYMCIPMVRLFSGGVRITKLQLEQVLTTVEEPSPWKPPGATSINGGIITTGAISSKSTITTANGKIAKWSIDTQGNARFADATIDGKLIVGGRGSENDKTSVQSDNYAAGIEGWAIKGNGDVEFNNGTFRGMLNLEKAGVDLTMNASVSPIDAYINTTAFKQIDTANIRGTTYGYKRTATGGSNVYEPTEPDPFKFAHFFIGPTTEKALNLQVHDGPEQDNIYLSEPPNNITLTSINIGEQTNPNAEPSFRENQGVVIKTYRNEARDYNLGGQQTGSDLNVTSSSYELLTRERSAVIPEIAVGESEYPQAKQEWTSTSVYETPKAKNLLPSNFVRGGAFAWTGFGNPSIASVVDISGVGQFGLGTHGHTIYNNTASAAEVGFDVTVNIPTAGPHIASFYVDAMPLLNTSIYVRVAENSASFIANEAVDPPSSHPIFGALGPNHTEVLPGTREKRVSFYIGSLAAGTRTIRFRFYMGSRDKMNIYKPQLERAAFRDDASLPAEIRQSYLPTPWTENDARSSSNASFRLQAEPIVDPLEFERSFDPAYGRISAEQTAEAVLSFSAENQSPGPKGYQAEDAEFKFSPKGLTFPGANVPYLPTGAAIDYDWTGMGTSRPAVGGSTSGMTTLINNHPVRVNNGKEIVHNFPTDIASSKDFQMPGWDIRNQAAEDVSLRVYAGSLRSSGSNNRTNPAGDGLILARRTIKMSNTDQSVTVTMLRLIINFGTWNPRGGPVINIDPATGARIVAYFDYDDNIIRVIRYSSYTTQAATILTAPFTWNSNAEFTLTLSRSGNTITLLANDKVLGTATNQSNLPNGLYTGLSPRMGSYRNFRASDGGDLPGAPGELVHAVNVNNGRGLSVDGTNGAINVSAPGFYQVSMYLLPDGKFGSNSADSFQIMVNSGGRNHRMSPNLSKYGDGVLLIQGSTIAYLTGVAEFLIWSNDGSVNRVNKADIRIVRLA